MDQQTAAPAPLDTDLAWACELAEQRAFADAFQALADGHSNPGGATVGTAGPDLAIYALTALDMSFFNRVVGLGVGAAATESQLDEVVAFYDRLDQRNVAISLAPQAQPPELEAWLGDRGFTPRTRWVKCWRTTAEPPVVATDLRIEEVGPAEGDAFGSIIETVFGFPPVVTPLASILAGRPGWHVYLGYDGDRPVSAAAMHIDGDVAWLGFGATLEAARGRGGQSAMFARRISDARDLGCRLVITETGEDTREEPNPSLHNMLRTGFQIAYLRPNWARS
jgi:GNAT superfamily N-acetyltransferase